MPSKNLVVFDLDGTLVDTAPDLAATMNIILAREGLEKLDPSSVRLMIGRGARALMERGLEVAGVEPTPPLLERLVADFLTVYEDRVAIESLPYPGVISALEALQASDTLLAVCTNKPAHLSEILLTELGLRGHFSALIGGDSLPRRKPHPDPLLEVISRAGGIPQKTAMVGDSIADIDTARAVGVPVIGVSFGYTETPMVELRPDRMINHFDQLPAALQSLGFPTP